MRKHALPQTIVPGAKKDIDPDTLKQKTDKRHRPIWVMPKPTGKHETTQVVTHRFTDANGKPKSEKIKRKVAFPIYRGVPADLARYMRSQMRRGIRLRNYMKAKAVQGDSFIEQVLKGG